MTTSKYITKVRSTFFVHFKINVGFLRYKELLEGREDIFRIDSRVVGLLHLISIPHPLLRNYLFFLSLTIK